VSIEPLGGLNGDDTSRDDIRARGFGRRRFLLGAASTVVLGAGTGAAVVFGADRDSPESTPDPTPHKTTGPTAEAPVTTSPTEATVPPVEAVPVELPDPDGPPADAYAPVPVNQIGSIAIPKIQLDHAVYEGVWLTVLDEGPGHWPGSAMPGQLGNTVFPGHRVTHSHPFRRLDELVPGDEITFTIANGTHTYTVRETLIVTPKDMWVVDSNPTAEVTLIACHPPHSARQRIVVKGELARSVPNGAAADAAAEIADAVARIPL
jgi:sortase A